MSKRKVYSESYKREIVNEYKSSKLSCNEFSKLKGLGMSTVQKWVYIYWDAKKDELNPSNNFIELNQSSYYELDHGDLKLRIPTSVSSKEVAELVRSLSA